MFKQPVDILNSLCSRITVIQFLSLRDSFYKVSAQMCEAAAPLDAGQVVIPLIAVFFQVALKAVQELQCIKLCPGFGILIEHDSWHTVFTGAEQPHERICFCLSFFFMQYLDSGFISHQELSF